MEKTNKKEKRMNFAERIKKSEDRCLGNIDGFDGASFYIVNGKLRILVLDRSLSVAATYVNLDGFTNSDKHKLLQKMDENLERNDIPWSLKE